MIYIIDSPLTEDSHSHWMMKIVSRFYPESKLNLLSLSEPATIESIIETVGKLKLLVSDKDVVLCSWQVDKNLKIDNVFVDLAKQCCIVVAAGNNAKDISVYSPTHLNEVITVGCLNKSGSKASHSNTSTGKLMKWVPGTNLHIDGHTETGTSVSAAIYAAWLSESLDKNDTYLLQDKLNEYMAVLLQEITTLARKDQRKL